MSRCLRDGCHPSSLSFPFRICVFKPFQSTLLFTQMYASNRRWDKIVTMLNDHVVRNHFPELINSASGQSATNLFRLALVSHNKSDTRCLLLQLPCGKSSFIVSESESSLHCRRWGWTSKHKFSELMTQSAHN